MNCLHLLASWIDQGLSRSLICENCEQVLRVEEVVAERV